jgi:hypothetical protein
MFVQQYIMYVLQCDLYVFQIEALFDFLLYTKSNVVLLMPLLITMQLFVDGLHSVLVIIILLSHLAATITSICCELSLSMLL